MDYLDSSSLSEDMSLPALSLKPKKKSSFDSFGEKDFGEKEKGKTKSKDHLHLSLGQSKEKKTSKKDEIEFVSSSAFKELGTSSQETKKNLSSAVPKSVSSKGVRRSSKRSPFLFLHRVILTAMILLGIWAVYGVSIETNFAFCRNMIGPDATNALQKLAGSIGDLLCVIGSVYP